MKAEIKIQDCPEPYAVIYTREITDEVRRILDYMKENTNTLLGSAHDKNYVLGINDIIKASVEKERTYLYTAKGRYQCGKRLYEVKKMLGRSFVQISKSVIVRISSCESVETDFGGMMLLHLNNGDKEYVSRHFLPEFKKSIGM